MQLAAQEVVVVGCSSGIGRALALELARAGARLTLFGRSEARLRSLADEVAAGGGHAAVAVGDTRDAARVAEVCAGFDAARPLFGVAFAAGVSHATSVSAFRVDEAREVMETNYVGFLHWFEHAAPLLRARRGGFFLGVSALCAYRGIPSGAVYAASKGALSNFLEGVRLDLEPEGVRVFEVMPGFVDTPMTELNTHISMPGMITAEAAGRAIVKAMRRGRLKIELPWLHKVAFLVARLAPVWLYMLASRSYVEGRFQLERALAALPGLRCAEHELPLVFNRYGSWLCLSCERRVNAVRDRFNVLEVSPELPDPGAPGSVWGGFCKVRAKASAFYAERLGAEQGPALVVGGGDGRLLRKALEL
ncbi:MAG: SDR family NAD(P)-dependent oxidoreductase, partial [Planctomycetes bacterium]|nr:SDR family NAD(P)-dependent oxidoreductase [Planctomycetota bacterium]